MIVEELKTLSMTHQGCLDHTLFPWSKQSGLSLTEVVSAHGNHFVDVSGKRYLDFSSQLVNVNFGHNHPKMKQAIINQMDKFAFIFPGAATEVKAELGRHLARIAPARINKVFYTVSGAEANENAMKIARLYTGKEKIITLYQSYHGASYGAVSASGDPRRFPISGSMMSNIVRVENPYSYRCPWGTKTPQECKNRALEQLERIINFEGAHTIAAIFIEGESGTSGCLKYPEGYWKGVSNLARKYNLLTISDEVMSGVGRTGEWFAVQYHGVEPDMITMAKGLTGGYLPLGGVMVSDSIAEYFEGHVLPLGLTNAAHPTCLAAAKQALEIYEEENLLEKVKLRSGYLSQKLEKLKEKHDCLGDVRLTGLLGCLEIVKNKTTKERMAPFNASSEEMEVMNKVRKSLSDSGVF
ncbi:MAG: aminotransferase class III-fold pyridoxal phosphate-dependent enzyme, partial [Crocinitomicaceae bacterium]|nr:aminotransferase class III-fold pyridoxal phosphate-dependent enzyme [Crocinitomicaceae bacterium]